MGAQPRYTVAVWKATGKRKMRLRSAGFLAIRCGVAICLPALSPAWAQQPAGGISAEERDIGRVDSHIQRYDQALGVVSRLRRPLGAETECDGICYFPSSSQPISWRCSPQASCELHCDVNPPVGGCR
jgi:hypothetical protein